MTSDASTTLSAEELRVLACLVEKSHTTPDQYPMSTNALVAACNQKTSRDPVVDYSASLVDRTMQLLRDGGWARSIRASGNRTFKHRHVVDERLGLTTAEQAVIAVLALRGPQSPGELKTRTERYHPFVDPAEVESVLDRLAGGEQPLVRNLGRGPGQSQDRWIQLLGPSPALDGPADPGSASESGPPAAVAAEPGPAAAVERTSPDGDGGLRERVDQLERRLARLERELGLESS